MYSFLADLLVAIHVGYCAYVVLGQVAIWVGWAMGRRFVRNLWFRGTHLLAITIVAVETVMGWKCPLTTWEEQLREMAGEPPTGESFVGRLMNSILFIDMPKWGFTVMYLAMFAAVVLTLVLCPPRRKRHERLEGAAHGVGVPASGTPTK